MLRGRKSESWLWAATNTFSNVAGKLPLPQPGCVQTHPHQSGAGRNRRAEVPLWRRTPLPVPGFPAYGSKNYKNKVLLSRRELCYLGQCSTSPIWGVIHDPRSGVETLGGEVGAVAPQFIKIIKSWISAEGPAVGVAHRRVPVVWYERHGPLPFPPILCGPPIPRQ